MSEAGVVVTGGQGLQVRLDDLERTAAVLADVGAELGVLALAAGRAAAGADLGVTAAVDPAGAVDVGGALAAALAGPTGLLPRAVAVQGQAARLVLAAARYAAADVLEEPVRDARRWVQGSVGLLLLPALAAVGALWWAATEATGGDPLADAERLLQAHPGVVEEVVGSLPGAMATAATLVLGPFTQPVDAAVRARTGTGLLPRTVGESAGLLALLYGDGRATVERVRQASIPAPTGLGALVGMLADADDAARGARQGELVVLRTAAGRRAASVVLLPGTKDWQVDPRARPYLNDLATNLDLVAGAPSARVDGVRQALAAAGARPGEPVLLVGYSQGGMVAMRAAAELRRAGAVTSVLTLGAPVGAMPAPDGVPVLSLENRADLVPALDAEPNDPDAARQVTVVFDGPGGSVRAAHDLRAAYLPAAAALATIDDPAVRSWLEQAESFLGERTVTATTFAVRNAEP